VIGDFKRRRYRIGRSKDTIVPESRENIGSGGHGATVKMSTEISIIKLEVIRFEHGVELGRVSTKLRQKWIVST
jgi:hypothetical protein